MPDTTFETFKFNGPVGKAVTRHSGREKVTGTATFSAEWPMRNMLHAVAVTSSIARGKILSFDTAEAKKLPGVRVILTPDNAPKAKQLKSASETNFQTSLGSSVYPCSGNEIYFAGQFIAAVVADTFETARDAALLVNVKYDEQSHTTDIEQGNADERPKSLFGAPPVIEIGNAEDALKGAEVTVDQQYPTFGNHHNPIEPHAAIADFRKKDGKSFLTMHESSQGLVPAKMTYAQMLGIPPEQVRVVCKYIGGAFGCKGATWQHSLVAIFCSMLTNQPVKVVMTRRQMYGGVGHRTPIQQRVAIGASKDGKINSIIHSGVATTATQDQYGEAFTMATRMMYQTDALKLDQKQCRLDTQVPTFMRAPAETPGMFALESAIDELAVELKMDPIELRIKNEPKQDLHQKKPFSGRLLVECLEEGAKRFGWDKRNSEPRSRQDGNWLIGTGVAAATYPAFSFPTSVRVTLKANGSAHIDCCSQEMGTGTMTVQSQLLADLLGLHASRVTMTLGDTELPAGGISGGSATTMSVGGAIRNAVDNLKAALKKIAPENSKLASADAKDIAFSDGGISVGNERVAFEDLLADSNKPSVVAKGEFKMGQDNPTSNHSFGATFVEVAVDEPLGVVRIRRMLGHYACGKILNAKTARSQFMGGMIMGVGHALQEATHWDHRLGRITNDNLAEYHVPVNADIPDLQIGWIDTPDFNASPIGAKGIGEISITGVAAAIANAIYNATGKRLRKLPITPESFFV